MQKKRDHIHEPPYTLENIYSAIRTLIQFDEALIKTCNWGLMYSLKIAMKFNIKHIFHAFGMTRLIVQLNHTN